MRSAAGGCSSCHRRAGLRDDCRRYCGVEERRYSVDGLLQEVMSATNGLMKWLVDTVPGFRDTGAGDQHFRPVYVNTIRQWLTIGTCPCGLGNCAAKHNIAAKPHAESLHDFVANA